jgi:dTDP-4-dehydrorhamnose reductase
MIWVIGDRGMLGTELHGLLAAAGVDHFGTDRECDIADGKALREAAKGRMPDWIVNCAAYTAVDAAETEEELAHRINAQGAGNIAACARELGAAMIHISTDYVFSGDGSEPYSEDDQVSPRCAYGRTKADGEEMVRRESARHFILRTAWLYGRHGGNFVHTMLRLMRERQGIGVVADQKGSPTWTRDLAAAVVHIITAGSGKFGTYHFTDEGETTWYDFAREIARLGLATGLLEREIEIRPLSTAEYPTRARRPPYSVLSKRKVREVLGCVTPDWKVSLGLFINDLAHDGLGAR